MRRQVAVDLRLDSRRVPIEQVQQRDPFVVLVERRPRRERREEVGVDEAAHVPARPGALLDPVRAHRRQIVDNRDAVMPDGHASLP